jgi:hypothetical protein
MDLDAPAGQNGEAAPDGHGAVAAETVEVAVALSQLGEPRGDGNDNRADDEDTGDLHNFDNRPFVENGNADDGRDNDDAYDDGGNENNFGSEGEERIEGDIGHVPMTSPEAEDTTEVAVALAQLGESRGDGTGDQAAEEDGGDNEIENGSEGEERNEGGIDPVPMTAPGHTRRKHKKVSPAEKKKNRATYDKQLHVRDRKRKHIAAMRALKRFNADFPLLL